MELHPRPTRVSAISYFSLALSSVFAIFFFMILFGLLTSSVTTEAWQAVAWLAGVCGVYVYCGWTMLKGRNIGRWIFLLITAAAVVSEIAVGDELWKMFFKLGFLVWAVVALLTPTSSEYFTARSKRGRT